MSRGAHAFEQVCSWAVIATALGVVAPAAAQDLVAGDRDRELLGPHAEVLHDPGGALTVGEAARRPFRRAAAIRPTYGLRSGALWARVRVQDPRGRRWVLVLGRPSAESFDVWVRGERGVRRLPASPITDRRLAVELPPLEEPAELLIRVPGPLHHLDAEIVARERFVTEAGRLGVRGLYYGALGALLLFDLLLWLVVRERSRAWYVASLGLTLACMAWLDGLPRAFGVDVASWPIGPGTPVAALSVAHLGFCRRLLDTAGRDVTADRWLRGAFGIGALATLAAAALPARPSLLLGVGSLLVALPFVLAVSVRLAARTRDPVAVVLALAWMILALYGVALCAQTLGLSPRTTQVPLLAQLGSAVEMVLMSLAVGFRLRRLDGARAEAELRVELERSARAAEVAKVRATSARRLVDAQEAERERVARELHDGLGHVLARIRQLSDGEVAALAVRGMDEARAIARDLYPPQLEELGLTCTLRALEEASADGRVDVRVDVDALDDAVGRGPAIHVYRVAQQAVANALEHAHPTEIAVRAHLGGEALTVSVEDDGIGMPSTPRVGHGVTGMRERARLLGGRLSFAPAETGGTRVELRVPIGGSP